MAFEYPGAVQGLVPYDRDVEEQVLTGIDNPYEESGEYGCRLSYCGLGPGVHASVCVDTFIDLKPKGKEGTSYFDVLCSPALYSGQEIEAAVSAPNKKNPMFSFFIEYFNEKDELEILYSDAYPLETGDNLLTWEIPSTGGHAIFRLGICLKNNRNRLDGSITIKTLDWSNVPVCFRMGKAKEMTPSVTPWTTSTAWLKTFVSSADRFFPDYQTTFAISHPVANGVVTTGTMDWDNYAVKSKITFSYQEQAGLVARAKGHRRYYGAVLTGRKALIYRQCDEKRHVIAEADMDIQTDETYELEFRLKEDRLILSIDGKEVVKGTDDHYLQGGAGFVVDSGAILADGFEIRRIL